MEPVGSAAPVAEQIVQASVPVEIASLPFFPRQELLARFRVRHLRHRNRTRPGRPECSECRPLPNLPRHDGDDVHRDGRGGVNSSLRLRFRPLALTVQWRSDSEYSQWVQRRRAPTLPVTEQHRASDVPAALVVAAACAAAAPDARRDVGIACHRHDRGRDRAIRAHRAYRAIRRGDDARSPEPAWRYARVAGPTRPRSFPAARVCR